MRRFFLLLFCAILAVGTVGYAGRRSVAAKRHAARVKLQSIHQKKKAVQQQVRMARARKHTWTEQLHDTQSQLRRTRENIRKAEVRLADTEQDLSAARRDLRQVREKLKRRKQMLDDRLVDTQRHGTVTYAAVMFDATDYWDFLSRRRLMEHLVRYDVGLVQSIRADERDVTRLQGVLLARQNQQEYLVGYLEGQRAQREGLMQEQANEVRQAAAEQAEAEAELAALQQASNEITNFLRRLVDTPAGRARAAVPYHGGLAFPVAARITSPFGMRFHPILHRYKLHTGIDFGVGIGTPIHAAGNGVVVHAGWWGAYGNAVIIDHGGGLTTLYGHMSRVGCSTGQSVQRGQVIGYVGSTGWSTGPHCHFEVRKNGVPVNPLAVR